MAETIPNLEVSGIQEDSQISTPTATETPSQPEPIQNVAPTETKTEEPKQEQSSTTNALEQMKGVQELAETTASQPAPAPAPTPTPEPTQTTQTTQTQESQTQESGTGANLPSSSTTSEGSGVQVDGSTLPSYTQNMTPEELESYKNTLEMINSGEENIVAFMAGESPLDAMIMDKALQQLRASQSAQLVEMKQSIAESGLSGKGEGDALLALIARDQQVAMGDMMSTLTIDARNRLEQWNKYGLEYGNKKFETMKSNDLALLDYLIERGASPEELNAHAGMVSEKYGVVMPDFTDPNNTVNYNKTKARYADEQNVLADKIASGDWEGYKALEDEMINSGRYKGYAFANQTPTRLEDFIEDYNNTRKRERMDMLSDETKFLSENGDYSGAASLWANAYDIDGIFSNGVPLSSTERARIEQSYLNVSPEVRAQDEEFTSIFNTMKSGEAGKDDILAFLQSAYDTNPTSPFGKKAKLYLDNQSMLDMPDNYLKTLETDRKVIASNLSINQKDPSAQDIATYTDSLVDSYGDSELARMGADLAKRLSREEMVRLGIDTNTFDAADPEDTKELYARYDLDQKMSMTSLSKDIELLEATIKARVNTNEYFDSPTEVEEFRRFLFSLTSSQYTKNADGTLSLTDVQYPWQEGSGSEHFYSDLDGNDFSGGYDYTLAQEDPYMSIGYKKYDEYSGKIDYGEFRRIYQSVDQSDTATFEAKLESAITANLLKTSLPDDVNISASTYQIILNDSAAPTLETSIYKGDGKIEIGERQAQTYANSVYEQREALNSIPANELKKLLLSEQNEAGDIQDSLVNNGSMFDLTNYISYNETDANVVSKVSSYPYFLENLLVASGMNDTGNTYVQLDGQVYKATTYYGEIRFEGLTSDNIFTWELG